MAGYSRPGVFTEEILNPIAPRSGVTTNAIAAFVGASDRGPVTPQVVSSWPDYVALYGSWNTTQNNNLPLALFTYFTNGGRDAVVLRVAASGATTATRAVLDRKVSSPPTTLTINAISPGAWGNNISFDITDSTYTTTPGTVTRFNLTVRYGGSTNNFVVESFTDLSMDPTSGRYFASIINGNSAWITVTDNASTTAAPLNIPALSSNVSLATGSDSGQPATSAIVSGATASLIDYFRPMVLNVPGVTAAADVNPLIAFAEARGDVFVVIDPLLDVTSSGVLNEQTLAASYTSSSYAAVYYPAPVIADPLNSMATSGAIRQVYPGGMIVGQYMATDASRGVFKAPAGISNKLAGVVSVKRLSDTELNNLNSGTTPTGTPAGAPAINAIKMVPGSGICVFGARTLKPGAVDRYVPVRRTLIEVRKSLTVATQFAQFEPNDARLWDRLKSVATQYLTQLWQSGGLKGDKASDAFYVKCDASLNTTSVIDAGEVRMEIGVALQRPAEFVIIRIGQYEGGSSVQEV